MSTSEHEVEEAGEGLGEDRESSPERGEPILELRNVSKRFGAVAALTDIDLTVHRHEVVALVGDNGAGKSTLVKTLAGVHAPTVGEIYFDGSAVHLPSPAAAMHRGIATVFQDLALCENLSVVDNLFLGRELRPWRIDSVTMETKSWALLRELSAKIPTVRIPVASLSGGQRQTVAIARSLLGDPKVIILDEPTAALGVAQTAEVLQLIRRLRDRGMGVLMISHNMADVLRVSDRVAVLRLGRNGGEYVTKDTSIDEIVSAITGSNETNETRRKNEEQAAS